LAKLTDPDDLVVASSAGNLGVDGNIWLDTSAKTLALAAYGVLVAKDGVTGNALWAKLVDLWAGGATYQPFPFPMNVFDARSGQYVFGQDPGGAYNGWKPASDATRQMIRDAGWSEYSGAGVLNRQYVGMVALASGFPSGAQFYYQRVSGGTKANFTFTDAPNEAIQVYGDAGNGAFDERAYFKLFCREYNYQYDDAVLGDVGESGTGAYKVALPIAINADLDITANDAAMTGTPYDKVFVNYFTGAFTRDIDTTTGRDFGIVIDVGGCRSSIDGSAPGGASVLTSALGGMTVNEFAGGTLKIYEGTNKGTTFPVVSNTATTITVTGTIAAGTGLSFTVFPAAPVTTTLKQIYTKVQYLLRRATTINRQTTSVIGGTAGLLLNFIGPSLKCGAFAPTNPAGGGTGVLVQGIADADLNSIVFYDNGASTREYPYASAGTMNFSTNLIGGYYRMFFTTLPGASDDYGEASAVTVNDKDGVPITGTISGATINFSFDYSSNVQGSRTAGQDAAVTLVCGNPGSAKPVVATGTINQSKAISITATAETDRAYLA
jgi:hypothetical protein